MKTVAIALFFAFSICNTFGQQVEISGTVTDENNLPFPNAKVMVKETMNVTHTDEEGTYIINAEIGQYLVFSHVGYYSMTVMVEDETPIHISMERDDATVIAAITGGFTNKKKQGYAVSTICGTDIGDNIQTDVTMSLVGKAPGISITPQTGFSGTTNRFVIRGLTTYNGSNYPLYIVDGVPYDTTITNPGNVICGDLGSNRSFDLDPNNIESVKVLKGLAATNIYGSEGRNGVVIITTKTGALSSR